MLLLKINMSFQTKKVIIKVYNYNNLYILISTFLLLFIIFNNFVVAHFIYFYVK